MAEETQSDVVGEENQHGIKVFGGATATAESPNPNPNPNDANSEKQKGNAEILDNLQPNAKEKETSKDAGSEKEKIDASKEANKEKAPNPDNKEKGKVEENKEGSGLNIDFGNQNKEKGEEPKPSTDNKQETVSVTREVVLDFLKNNGFDDIKDLNELSKTDALPDAVAKFKQYHEETGRGISDFYNLQKDWKAESKESAIKEFLRLKHPDLDEDQINTQFDVFNVTDDDEEQLSSRELNRAKAEFDKTYSEALSFLNKKTKEYQVPLENVQKPTAKQSEVDIAKAHEPYWKERDKFLNTFDEIKFNIEGIGDIKIQIDEDDKKAITARTQTVDSMIGSWQNEDNSVNHSKLVPDNAWAIPSVREKMLKSIMEQTHTLTLDKFSKQNRNVDLDDLNKKQGGKNENNNGALVKIGESKKSEGQSFGTPIVRQ